MKLKDLAQKPKLVKVIIDDKDIVETYGEELEFYVNDRLPIATYTSLASVKQNNIGELFDALKNLILDEEGKPVMDDEKMLPMDLLNAAVEKVTANLGK
mgnify:CR=1 FL=1|jgi:hypothetical protein|tara:strand:+ start:408 stop:704 length:297 start_codon:yes stop_codon:yes gene_type:complete